MENKIELSLKLRKDISWSEDLLPYIDQSQAEADYVRLYVPEEVYPDIETLINNYIQTTEGGK